MEGVMVDFAFFITDFNTKTFSNEDIKRLHGVEVTDRTDLVEAVRLYVSKLKKEVDE